MKMLHLSKKQKSYIVVTFVVAAIAGVFLGMNSAQRHDPLEQQSPGLNSNALEVLQNESKTTAQINTALAASAKKINAVDKASSVKSLSTNQNIVKGSGWIVGDVKMPAPTIPLSEKVSQYQVVSVETPEVYPTVGQRLSLPMFNGKSVTVNVQSVANLQNGDYSWSGHVEGFDDDYPVVMTYGAHSVFATITTPEGSYTMESVDGATGWLYKNPSEFELMTPGAKDYIEVTDAQ